MSIKVITYVWENSKQRGSALLMLLAIADNANDQGEAFPGVSTLARKTRMTERNAQMLLTKLETAAELIIQERDGTSNLYIIPVPWRTHKAVSKHIHRGVKRISPLGGVKGDSPGGEEDFTPGVKGISPEGVKPASSEPSLEPSIEPSDELLAPDGASSLPSLDDVLEALTPSLYPCTPQDIAELIATWYDWVPLKPTQRGKVVELKKHIQNKTNREYAESLYQRGVRPGDLAQALGEMRLRPPAEGWPEMNFCYVGRILEEWVARDRLENIYTLDCPRIVPRRPGVKIDLGDLTGLTADEIGERIGDNPDLIIDIPPPYISPHAAADADDFQPDTALTEEELSPDRWEKEGMPL